MTCLDDDAQGQSLEVVWDLELDTEVIDEEAWRGIGKRGFDPVRQFGAYLHTLRWNCVTATDPKLFQAPFRAGIRIDAYQLEPLRKALLLPRVNLFIADDVGLGKTIEAGLIASELQLRRRVREIVVACPPSMVAQWKEELESRFGLTFEVLDRAYLERVREERGYSVNPWTTFPRFLVSHKLLIDEVYAAPLRDWLDNLRPGSLLILDEAHHAAPSSGSRYAIDSRITKTIRDLAPRFEHRLFLSATPHNGHSNSFSALLELMDPQRFTRGVKVRAKDLDPVMVRRLKDDVREVAGGFPKRLVRQIDLRGLPEDASELVLSKLLDQYRQVRLQRVAGATKRKQTETMLLISGLQQRLLSSIEAFARTLAVHRRTMEKVWSAAVTAPAVPVKAVDSQLELVAGDLDPDDDRAELDEAELAQLEDAAIAATTEATAGSASTAEIALEKDLLSQMEKVAHAGRGVPDARMRHLGVGIAAGPSIAIKPKKTHGAPVPINLDELLAQSGNDRAKWLKAKTDQELTGDAATALKNARTVDDLLAALERRIARSATPSPVPKGAMLLVPSDERRRSGSNYTPRSLTEPIVRKTLEPILKRLGDDVTPEQILELKVCDPAMGSGAFLVEACRQLAEVLVEAWHRHKSLPTLPPDEDELLYAKRLIAQRCLYGVDKNPMAADLAKLSMWLATLARDHPFTFLNHSFRAGDSLVGLTRRQIACQSTESLRSYSPKAGITTLQDWPKRQDFACPPKVLCLTEWDSFSKTVMRIACPSKITGGSLRTVPQMRR